MCGVAFCGMGSGETSLFLLSCVEAQWCTTLSSAQAMLGREGWALSVKPRGHGVCLWTAVSVSPGHRNRQEGVSKCQERQKKTSARGARNKYLILIEAWFGSSGRFYMLISISRFRPKCVTNILCEAPWPDPLPLPSTHTLCWFHTS